MKRNHTNNSVAGVKIYVDPDFRSYLKRNAVEEGKTIIELTRDYARNNLIKDSDRRDEKKKPFSFRI